MVHISSQPGNIVGAGQAFIFGLVSQHRAFHHVADGPDAGHFGGKIMIDRHAALCIERKPGRSQVQAVGIGPAADGKQHHIGCDGFGRAAGSGFDRDRRTVAGAFHVHHLGGGFQLHTLFLHDARKGISHFDIHRRHDARGIFHHRHPGTQTPPDAAHFQADISAADHHQMLGNLGQAQRFGGGDDHFPIGRHAGQQRDFGTGGDDEVPGGDDAVTHLNRLCIDEAGFALHPLHLVLLEQHLDAAGEFLHGLVLLAQQDGKIEGDIVGLHAELGQMPAGQFLIQMAAVEQRLRRDAANVEAGAAQRRALLHAGHLQAMLRRANGSDITAGAAADDDDIKFRVGHGTAPYRSISKRAGSSMASFTRTRKVTASRPSIRR